MTNALNLTPVIDILGAQHRPKVVLLPGWGCLKADLLPLAECLAEHYCVSLLDLPGYGSNVHWTADYRSEQSLCQQLLAVLPEQAVYIGWSFGGNIALSLAQYAPHRVLAVATVATNPSFVARDGKGGMESEVFTDFEAALATNAPLTLRRFLALQLKGEDDERSLLKLLRQNAHILPASEQTLGASLAMLGRFDQGAALSSLLMPTLAVFAEHDALVPVAVADQLGANVQCKRIGSGHRPFLRRLDELQALINDFVQSLPCSRSKQQVADSFSRAAESYDGAAQLQRDIADQLFNLVDVDSLGEQAVVVDLGCGTGYSSARLARRYPQAKFVGLDIAEGMLTFARQQSGQVLPMSWLAADAEALPLADHSIDVIYSSLAVQWCEHQPSLFAELKRVLKPGGRCYFSTLVDGTLTELQQAWATVDDYVHVNSFASERHWRDCATASDLSVVQWQQPAIVLQYSQLKQLTGELKAIGAHNVNGGRPGGLTGRARVKALRAGYELHRNAAGLLPATYQVLYGVLEA
ncbi:malonyl-CoA O-methyltransferase [Sinobacterium caligoides]|uniref:Malonyl-[acyl-carrier protein] O-methyltransferase n=1 Tax=Sinobacterium caligoides TaxID=933926 RepID=A0A3N2DQH8_9GAMM|nr:malonyl-ACP O-methyltransferase BioC [Sinobacterium caligoides]ROS01932.1 malonyl-CoA O-methyltransferase [Sinobacterium caligoides]